MPSYAIIEAPSRLGLTSAGVEQLAGRLLTLGFAELIGARQAGAVAPPPPGGRDPETTILNAREIAAYAPHLADAVEAVLDRGEWPIVLGGDCTILLGPMLALRRRGRFGLLFIDGHADFFQAEAEPNGEGASMELAWVTGFGPEIVTDHEGFHPLVRVDDVAVLGYRDHEDQAEAGSQKLPQEIVAYDLPAIRRFGIDAAVRGALDVFDTAAIEGFFIHLDVDVLDDAVMPAVDFRLPGGLGWADLETALRLALAHPKAVGLEVTIYNPALDETGDVGRKLVDRLAEILSPATPPSRM